MNKVSKLIHDCNFRINFFTTSKNIYLINEINNQINKLYFETDECQKLSIYMFHVHWKTNLRYNYKYHIVKWYHVEPRLFN